MLQHAHSMVYGNVLDELKVVSGIPQVGILRSRVAFLISYVIDIFIHRFKMLDLIKMFDDIIYVQM